MKEHTWGTMSIKGVLWMSHRDLEEQSTFLHLQSLAPLLGTKMLN